MRSESFGPRCAIACTPPHGTTTQRCQRAVDWCSIVGVGLAEEIVDTFLSAEFEGGRHARRVDQLTALEEEF